MTKKLFDFEAEFKLGIEEIDSQHIILIEMLNDAFTLMKEGKKNEARILFEETLVSYVNSHFAHEENFMEQIGFPGLEDHRRIHNNFRKFFLSLKTDLESASEVAFRNVLSAIFSWILNHIGKTDRKYANFYLANMNNL